MVTKAAETIVPKNITPYQQYIHKSRYARWIVSENRRENWNETVQRYVDFFSPRIPEKYREETTKEIQKAIFNLDVMPSMRSLMSAGPALQKDNVAGFNCSYLAVDDPKAFDEAMYISMCFHPDTLIRVKGGVKPISQIEPGDLILSKDEQGFFYQPVDEVMENPTENETKLELEFDDGYKIKCTANHKFLTQRGYVPAAELTFEDEIVEESCSIYKITKRTTIEQDGIKYFDLKMPIVHNYVLGNGAVVHNCGSGVGFSVERQYVNQLPTVSEVFFETDTVIKVRDSKIGWASAFRQLISLLYGGLIPKWDMSAIRPAGAPLKTMGGRASGPDPLERLFKFSVSLFQKAAGRKLTSLECHDLMCMVADIVVVGGVRRSAMLSLSNLSDERMRNAKNGQWWVEFGHRRLANNSVAYTEKPDPEIFIREFLTLIESKSGERGIFNRKAAQLSAKKTGRRKWENIEFGCNPCVTGDTRVYVADGRGNVPISQLAQEGKDVPVFCFNNKGKIVIRWMRNPRLTGHQTPVLQVLLDDGSCLKVTKNHKFRLKSGLYIEACELKAGDSLSVATRFEASIKDIFKTANSNSQDYFWLNCGQSNTVAEHRIIAEGGYGVIPKGFVVHHKDFNAQNNNPNNLEVMSKQAHDLLHSKGMLGDLNPMRRAQSEWSKEKWGDYSTKMSQATSGENNGRYSGISNEVLKQHALSLSEQLGHRFSKAEWVHYAQERGLPQHFSKWRESHLNGVMGLAKWAAVMLGFDYVDADPRVAATYTRLTQEGYDCSIVEDTIIINKNCEICGTAFTVDYKHREVGVCGQRCAGKRTFCTHRETIVDAMRIAHSQNRDNKRQKQLEVYSKLQWDLGRTPLKDEWSVACKKSSVSAEICRTSSPFSSWAKLQEAAPMYNHKVVSVTPCETADVYNGTVDEFHNFFVGAFEGLCANGKRKWVYVNNLQCGEILLRPKGFCNLSECVIRPSDTKATLKNKIRIATIIGCLQSTLTDFRYLRKEWQKNAEEERLLGVSLTGIMDNKVMSTNGPELESLLDELKEYAISVATKWAEILDINIPTSITTVKPSGTVSQLVNSSSGIHTRYSPYLIRSVREDRKSPVSAFLKHIGVPNEPESMKPNDVDVFYFPLKSPDSSLYRNDLTAIQQLEMYQTYKTHWTEHNPSCTVYVKESEWTDVLAWVYKHFDIIGGVSFLPHSDHIYAQAPYTEITKEKYEELMEKMPRVDWALLSEFEKEDATAPARELACSSGSCEIL